MARVESIPNYLFSLMDTASPVTDIKIDSNPHEIAAPFAWKVNAAPDATAKKTAGRN